MTSIIVLNTVYKDAIINREKILSILKGPKFEQILQKARVNWNEYTPTKENVVTAGIDSSFNNTKFQGIELWATTAVSIKTDGVVLVDLHDSGLGSDTDLSRIASKMEIDACEKTVDEVDLVLMDGSLHSQFMTRQSSLDVQVVRTMNKRKNVIFIAKTSNTKKQFENLGSLAGDIFYYNHVTNGPGFSEIFVEKNYGIDKIISSTFVRLSDSTPIIKLEFLGGKHDNEEVKSIMNKLFKTSVGGYPYALKLAHNNCKISDKELGKMVSLLGLSNEIGSREVLG
ncbi:MAG: DNA double-strand break repair nuclease NurA [Candidatus Nitrosopumilus limneticus]|nr:DNA double-strand break repair nuclease NurA [Candidatus Nitrosopumilus limneticus]MDC4215131.1 DNA double-strand break repair nuclease NurA [Candidatus Nitrosopumilus limneticus]MDC4215944.1 DNA double-strand break repair nuclease NurA [Candidatus Nitrosopumilus limneticus]MDC4217194.1 DNA double-strand break repair nuclease NurA [Candidatus Nitrosopumilus limneticus]MDC4218490.1 DNA double-strand break repair nuclease NurA [Candidatus Nitrosopumilus limneticus]